MYKLFTILLTIFLMLYIIFLWLIYYILYNWRFVPLIFYTYFLSDLYIFSSLLRSEPSQGVRPARGRLERGYPGSWLCHTHTWRDLEQKPCVRFKSHLIQNERNISPVSLPQDCWARSSVKDLWTHIVWLLRNRGLVLYFPCICLFSQGICKLSPARDSALAFFVCAEQFALCT